MFGIIIKLKKKHLLNIVKTNVSGIILWKNHVTSLPIKELETNKKIKNDYTCILSIKFK